MADNRTVDIKVRVTVDEYYAIAHIAQEIGVSHSALGRMVFKEKIRRFHDEMMAEANDIGKNPSPK